jgi:flagellar biosynthesis/type III secretory pathway chaperone
MRADASLISEVEGLLVRQFQITQDLLALTREERRALLTGDVHNLALLVDRKEFLLDEFSQLDEMCRMRINLLAKKFAIQEPVGSCLVEIAPHLSPRSARRWIRLCQGISALKAEILDLTPGNQSLALEAAGRAFALQRSLLETPELVTTAPRGSLQ